MPRISNLEFSHINLLIGKDARIHPLIASQPNGFESLLFRTLSLPFDKINVIFMFPYFLTKLRTTFLYIDSVANRKY